MYEKFFAYARERQTILVKRRRGEKWPWTDDPILCHYKFCNVMREDDRTTIWLRENVREKIKGPELLLATILFRWFNRISTGEAIFQKPLPGASVATGWDCVEDALIEGTWDATFSNLKSGILEHCGSGPYVTGAYCIIGMPHMPKIDGILACVRNVVEDGIWRSVAEDILTNRPNVRMESVWHWFRNFPRSGDFMAYEIVTDLQNTPGWLDEAPDRMEWANAGPGAIRGLNRIHSRPLEQQHQKEITCGEMRHILRAVPLFWPIDWPVWDMRTVEHTLCEFDKYERIRLNEGKVKGVYRPS